MRCISFRPVRSLKTANFCLIWALSLILTYQSLVVNQPGPSRSTLMTDSPATLADSIVKACVGPKDTLVSASSSGDGVIVLSRRSPRAAAFIHQILQRGTQVLTIADPEVFVHLRRWSSDDVIPDRLTFVNVKHHCTKKDIVDVWKYFRVKTVHLFFDEFDFSDADFASDLSSILSCIVRTLETIAHMKDVTIFEHSSRHRHTPRLAMHHNAFTLHDMHSSPDQHLIDSESAAVRQSKVPRNHKVNSCDPLYNYDFYEDVFMKTVNIITKTYVSLYKLKCHHVIHPS